MSLSDTRRKILSGIFLTTVVLAGLALIVEKRAPAFYCAGEWTRAVARINAPEYNNQMVVRNAHSSQDAWRRAQKCRPDAQSASYFEEGARLACAPYLVCDTQ